MDFTNKHSRHGQSTHRKACREPAIRDAQKPAQNVFSALKLGYKLSRVALDENEQNQEWQLEKNGLVNMKYK